MAVLDLQARHYWRKKMPIDLFLVGQIQLEKRTYAEMLQNPYVETVAGAKTILERSGIQSGMTRDVGLDG